MSLHHAFLSKMPTTAQRARIMRRRRLAQAQDGLPDSVLLDNLQRTINTQLNGIIGVLEMIRQHELAADQRELIGLAQRSANALLSHAGQLLETTDDNSDQTTLVNGSLPDIRALIVMPDRALRTQIENELTRYGMRVAVFERADAALTALEQAASSGDPYRIALLDQEIHGIDGETLGTAIGTTPTYRDTLIVLASNEHNRHDAERLALAGFSAWLPKPVSKPMLIDTLTLLCSCIVKKDAPRFVCAGVRVTREQVMPETADSFAEAHVLVVDDNPVNLEVAERMLTRFGCLVDTASDGEQALQMAETQRYDLILMDCQMPGMDDYQATAMLRAAEGGLKHTPIVGWSSRTSRNERDTCLAIGMDDFISKPMRIRALNDILVRWLQHTNMAETPQADDELDATQQMFGEDFPELAHLFLADSPKRLGALRDAVEGNDAIAITKLAHVLCGSSASIGATLLAALCRELEVSARNGAPSEARPRLNAIEFEYARIDARLSGMLQSASHLPPVR